MDIVFNLHRRRIKDGVKPIECVSRYLCTKSSWRGRYRRVVCVTLSSVITQLPDNLAPTNVYNFTGDQEIETIQIVQSRGDVEELEFMLLVKQDRKVRTQSPFARCQLVCF